MTERQRIDKWLYFARVVKTRTLAAKLAQSGRVRLNREKTSQASQQVKPGDVLTITLDRSVRVLKVLAPGERRGPASEAQTLYEDLTPKPEPKDDRMLQSNLAERVGGRPTKRDRRVIDRLRKFPDSAES